MTPYVNDPDFTLPFIGTGTTALAARKLGRRCVGIELNPEHGKDAARRLGQQTLLTAEG